MSDDVYFAAVVGWMIVGAFVGLLIGRSKGRPEAGFIMGALLGVIGWVLLLAGPDLRPKCPKCFGAVPDGAELCRHCGSQVREPYPEGFPRR